MSAPSLARLSSNIGTASMTADLRSALDNTDTLDVPGIDSDIEESIEAEVQKSLAPVPQMTQGNYDDDDDAEDDSKVGQITELYPDMNKMSYALKNKHAELWQYTERAGTNPYDMLAAMQKQIDAATNENKQQDIAAYNTLVTLFGAAREDENLRQFAADLFTSLNHYKEDKPKIAVLKEEIKILNTLYAEKEEENVLTVLRAKQKARQETVAAKGKAQGEKRVRDAEEKEKEKETKKSAKKSKV